MASKFDKDESARLSKERKEELAELRQQGTPRPREVPLEGMELVHKAELMKQFEGRVVTSDPITPATFLSNQKELCDRTGAPFFMPSDGVCYSCSRDIMQELIVNRKEDGTKLVTGCPLCHRSYCD